MLTKHETPGHVTVLTLDGETGIALGPPRVEKVEKSLDATTITFLYEQEIFRVSKNAAGEWERKP